MIFIKKKTPFFRWHAYKVTVYFLAAGTIDRWKGSSWINESKVELKGVLIILICNNLFMPPFFFGQIFMPPLIEEHDKEYLLTLDSWCNASLAKQIRYHHLFSYSYIFASDFFVRNTVVLFESKKMNMIRPKRLFQKSVVIDANDSCWWRFFLIMG